MEETRINCIKETQEYRKDFLEYEKNRDRIFEGIRYRNAVELLYSELVEIQDISDFTGIPVDELFKIANAMFL